MASVHEVINYYKELPDEEKLVKLKQLASKESELLRHKADKAETVKTYDKDIKSVNSEISILRTEVYKGIYTENEVEVTYNSEAMTRSYTLPNGVEITEDADPNLFG